MTNTTLLGAAAALCSLVMMTATPASADLLDDITQAKKIRISTDVAIPPSGMMDSSMKPTGSDVEVAQLLAKDWGLELEFIQTTGATRIPNVLTGKADVRQPGRGETTAGVIYYKNNSGLAIQFAAAGGFIYRKAVAEGRCRTIPTEWFGSDLSADYEAGFRPSP